MAGIKSKGLQFGIYGAAGETTCASKAGGLYHERVDAQTYADWGATYLKYDDCGEVTDRALTLLTLTLTRFRLFTLFTPFTLFTLLTLFPLIAHSAHSLRSFHRPPFTLFTKLPLRTLFAHFPSLFSFILHFDHNIHSPCSASSEQSEQCKLRQF
jgi:hypothetical protein